MTPEEPALNLYIINAVNGQIVHSTRIKDGASPVKFLQAENWVVMHYWNSEAVRWELYVVDLYENKQDEGVYKLLKNSFMETYFGKKTEEVVSAFKLETPVPVHQTFIFPAAVKSMGLTLTEKGITPKNLLLGLADNRIATVNKEKLLNPRRPYRNPDGSEVKLSKKTDQLGQPIKPDVKQDRLYAKLPPKNFQVTKDEYSVPPYHPLVLVQPTDIISYYQDIQTEKFVAAPTSLESTSLVFAYGLDLFFAIQRPALSFDILGEDFDYFVLFSTSMCVFIGLGVSQYIVRNLALEDRWK